MPVLIYLHGNSSSRLEGLKIATELFRRNINLFVFDFAGCGLSEGDYISLGIFLIIQDGMKKKTLGL
jgi:hypothetical protein